MQLLLYLPAYKNCIVRLRPHVSRVGACPEVYNLPGETNMMEARKR
jgi:hypothetical protein